MMPLVDLQLATEHPHLCPSQEELSNWVALARLETTPAEFEVTIRLVDREESQTLNHSYRSKDKPTNVLSFPFDAPIDLTAEGELTLLGDLVICVPLLAEEAEIANKPIKNHWAHLVIHGILHLQGLDHLEDEEAAAMEALEIQLLAQLGIPDPYRPVANPMPQQVDQ